jgi:mediator of RNA polymerase II transcription subunit 5
MQLNVENLTIDLILSSFDLLSCAMTRKESQSVLLSLKSFLINKIPLIIIPLSQHMFPSDRVEFCITQAMPQVDKEIFPSIGSGTLSNIREEFLFSCVLHSLLRADNVQGLLGEPTLSTVPNPSSRYTKDTLVEQCNNDSERAVQLVDELEKLDGNGGAISLAMVEVCNMDATAYLHTDMLQAVRSMSLKSPPDTSTLKSLCVALAGKPRCIDILMQFVSPAALLQPICQVLDNWRYEDETGI